MIQAEEKLRSSQNKKGQLAIDGNGVVKSCSSSLRTKMPKRDYVSWRQPCRGFLEITSLFIGHCEPVAMVIASCSRRHQSLSYVPRRIQPDKTSKFKRAQLCHSYSDVCEAPSPLSHLIDLITKLICLLGGKEWKRMERERHTRTPSLSARLSPTLWGLGSFMYSV